MKYNERNVIFFNYNTNVYILCVNMNKFYQEKYNYIDTGMKYKNNKFFKTLKLIKNKYYILNV